MSDSIQRTSVGDFPISQTVTVPASASLIFVSGTLPDPADPQVPGVYGNTEVQTVSVFNKLRKVLQQQDLDLAISCNCGCFWWGLKRPTASWILPGCSVGIRSSSVSRSSRTNRHGRRCKSSRCHCPERWLKSKPSLPAQPDSRG